MQHTGRRHRAEAPALVSKETRRCDSMESRAGAAAGSGHGEDDHRARCPRGPHGIGSGAPASSINLVMAFAKSFAKLSSGGPVKRLEFELYIGITPAGMRCNATRQRWCVRSAISVAFSNAANSSEVLTTSTIASVTSWFATRTRRSASLIEFRRAKRTPYGVIGIQTSSEGPRWLPCSWEPRLEC
jgi:hypothetical protein